MICIIALDVTDWCKVELSGELPPLRSLPYGSPAHTSKCLLRLFLVRQTLAIKTHENWSDDWQMIGSGSPTEGWVTSGWVKTRAQAGRSCSHSLESLMAKTSNLNELNICKIETKIVKSRNLYAIYIYLVYNHIRWYMHIYNIYITHMI